MQVYKGAKQLKISNKELINLIDRPDVNHHMDKIPEDLLEDLGLVEKKISASEPESTQTVDSAETVMVGEENESETDSTDNDADANSESSIESDDGAECVLSDSSEHVQELGECPYTKEEIALGCRGCGNKSTMWKWRHLIA